MRAVDLLLSRCKRDRSTALQDVRAVDILLSRCEGGRSTAFKM